MLDAGLGLDAELIGDLYDVAIDEGRWPSVADLLAKATGVDAAGLWVTEQGAIVDMASTAVQRETEAPYIAHFHKLDPWNRGLVTGRPDTVALACEHTPEDMLLRTEFYNDFARKFGLFRPMGAMIGLASGVVATVAVERTFAARHFEPEDKARLELLLPHVKRALQLRRSLLAARTAAAVHGAALDALAFGAVVCDAAGHVVFANAEAERLAARRAGVLLGAAGLRALVSSESAMLARLVRDAAGGGAGGTMRLTDGEGGVLLVLVSPLPRSLSPGGAPGHALVALRAAEDDPGFTVATLAALFRLSPAQADTALALYQGMSPEQIAETRGLRLSTVRTHLAEIFLRTGADGQRDLMRLLGAIPPLRRAR